ncbi:MAG: hypothetical protein ABSA91_13420 [Acidimicrobiales bacterium]
MGVVKRGRSRPLTLFAPGGHGENLDIRMQEADRVPGTKIGFAYENSGYFAALASIPRQAERDAAEVRAVAHALQVTQAIGFSRGARAIVGALAEGAAMFQRIALVVPPGGRTRAGDKPPGGVPVLRRPPRLFLRRRTGPQSAASIGARIGGRAKVGSCTGWAPRQ